MRWLLTFIGFNALLLAAVLVTMWAFGGFADYGLSGTGWFALCLGVAFTAGLGVALMALVFHSARKDYDEDAYRIRRRDR
jgi:ABC-type multidrug transport system permease subunit